MAFSFGLAGPRLATGFAAVCFVAAVALGLAVAQHAAPIRCGPNPTWGTWGSNVSCPAGSEGCVNRSIYSGRNGYPWACNVSSRSAPGRYTVCATGAPFPLSNAKKNVLVIGDSVSNGYFQEGSFGSNVPQLIQDVALAQHAPFSPGSGGAGPTSHGLDCLDVYLNLATGEPARYDAITFNFGLHDLGNTTADVQVYTQQLGAIADRLLATKAKLLYLLTTPMEPNCCGGYVLHIRARARASCCCYLLFAMARRPMCAGQLASAHAVGI